MTLTERRRDERMTLTADCRLAAPIAAASAVAVGAAYVAARNPYTSITFPPCTFHAATGLYCPGCGGTRALFSAMHGDFGQALQMNALTTLLFVPPVAFGLLWWLGYRLGLTKRRFTARPWMGWAYGGVALAFTVVRNLPGMEFLRP